MNNGFFQLYIAACSRQEAVLMYCALTINNLALNWALYSVTYIEPQSLRSLFCDHALRNGLHHQLSSGAWI